VIRAFSNGRLEPPPQNAELVFGYKHSTPHPEGEWWWAVADRENNFETGQFALQETQSWLRIIRRYAPTAKLMLNGRSHRNGFGPELSTAELALLGNGIKLRFDHYFAYPKSTGDLGPLF
jgi:hypothetical protein